MVNHPRMLRGDIVEILNPMVREGLISGFRTNLTPNDQNVWPMPEVIVTSASDDLIAVQRMVEQALAAKASGVRVTVQRDLPPESRG